MPSKRIGRRSRDAEGAAPGRAASGVPVVPGYSQLEVIGRGATSTVYSAVQEAFGRTVAVKLLHVDVSDRRAQRRFEREKTINGRLSHHPNVVTVLEAGFVDGSYPYLAMEYFEHGSLARRLAERGPFSVGDALHVGVRISGALASAHSMGVLHRDVKPQNVLLSRFGEPALADFGISALIELEHSVTVGLTPVHAAPEILEGDDPSPQSDVYALASTLYTLLSGVPPFAGPAGEGVLAQLLRITTLDLPTLGRDDVPGSLFDVLRAAMAKRPEDRTPDAATFGRALQAVERELGLDVTGLPLDTPPEPLSAAAPRSSAGAPDAVPGVQPVRQPADAPVDEPGEHLTVDLLPEPPSPTVDTPTVAARQLPPEVAEARRPRRLPVLATVGVAAVVVGGAATYFALRDTSDDPGVPGPLTDPGAGPIASAPNVATVAPATIAAPTAASTVPTASTGVAVATTLSSDQLALVATDVVASADGDPVTLAWRDNANGAPMMVEILRPGDAEAAQHHLGDDERTFFVAEDVAPTEPVCFLVRTFVGYAADGQGQWANSEPACINGAELTPLSPSPTSTDP